MISDHVSLAISATGVPALLLCEEQRRVIVLRLLERLGVNVFGRAPWDHPAAPLGMQKSDGWKLIPKYVGGRECLLFPEGAGSMWTFSNGSDLLRVLENCQAIEFYVADKDAGYLLCFNHHDFIVGWGEAAQWVANGLST